jgi:hypothetical protein
MRRFILYLPIVLAFVASSCGRQSEPLAVKVLRAAVVTNESSRGVVMGVEVELQNRGKKPVHLSYDSVRVITAEGERSSMRSLRHALKRLGKHAVTPDQQELLESLKRLGIDERGLRDLAEDVIEIAPGIKLMRTFPFSLEKQPEGMVLELAYHDVASDEIFQVRQEVCLEADPAPFAR